MPTPLEKTFTLCTTKVCPLSMLCERKHRQAVEGQHYQDFGELEKVEVSRECNWYMPRTALTDEGKIFRQKGRKGMKSNRHVLPHQRKRMTPEELGLKIPDLMVKRHIRMGHDINKDKD